ncbi:translesion DNA synthesis-associated protein ImuA [Sessilibacter corallicola]|uniref:translesion DNA synthesis-associated protein ImuA n=1 Tax=Sessilibacter corallicola TaxID=2904075 RepID=UPI001E39DE91|nr:translesion DNA synthesis-associated protein ImuA [Sessilibacter corallicola]MCE2030338.1 translesion DNA synthesis-associated protein ImuA [Sessilibacter corallicola]
MDKLLETLPSTKTPNPVLADVLSRKDVWRGQRLDTAARVISSGYPVLDQMLQGQGWPIAELIDVTQPANGHGEWHLLSPTLANLSQKSGYILLFNPPAMPYGPGLEQQGIDPRKIRVIKSTQQDVALSALVDMLQAQCSLAVLAWENNFHWRYAQLRKLQIAATHGDALSICFRKNTTARVQSPAPLRLHTQLKAKGLEIELLKQRGQTHQQQCTLALPRLSAPVHVELGNNLDSNTQVVGSNGLGKVLPFQRASTQSESTRQGGI